MRYFEMMPRYDTMVVTEEAWFSGCEISPWSMVAWKDRVACEYCARIVAPERRLPQ